MNKSVLIKSEPGDLFRLSLVRISEISVFKKESDTSKQFACTNSVVSCGGCKISMNEVKSSGLVLACDTSVFPSKGRDLFTIENSVLGFNLAR